MTAQAKPGDLHVYHIRLSGSLDEDWLAAFCPAGLKVEHTGDIVVLSNLITDQAGLVGLIRQLHGLGCTLLSVNCCPEAAPGAAKNNAEVEAL